MKIKLCNGKKLRKKAIIILTSFFTLNIISTGFSLSIYGPRIDELNIKIFPNDTAEFKALEDGDIDLLECFLHETEVKKWSQEPYNDTIVLDPFIENGIYEFDLNNNLTLLSYPNWPSPTYYPEFRCAIAYMVDKSYIVNNIIGGLGTILKSPTRIHSHEKGSWERSC